jgi:hypothetical protein
VRGFESLILPVASAREAPVAAAGRRNILMIGVSARGSKCLHSHHLCSCSLSETVTSLKRGLTQVRRLAPAHACRPRGFTGARPLASIERRPADRLALRVNLSGDARHRPLGSLKRAAQVIASKQVLALQLKTSVLSAPSRASHLCMPGRRPPTGAPLGKHSIRGKDEEAHAGSTGMFMTMACSFSMTSIYRSK